MYKYSQLQVSLSVINLALVNGEPKILNLKEFSKEEKQDILHLAVCKLLTPYGYFKFEKVDEDGWPHWIELKAIKNLSGKQQDLLIKEAILTYFS